MKDKIDELKKIYDGLDIIIWCLEGGAGENETVNEILVCYDYLGEELSRLIDELIKEHGNEVIKTK